MTDYNRNTATKKHRDLFRGNPSPFTVSPRQQPPTHPIAATAEERKATVAVTDLSFRGHLARHLPF